MIHTDFHRSPLDLGADFPVMEMPASTRHEEARLVMSLVDGLLDAGVHRRDIAIVVRDLNDYEYYLRRAAIRRGITPTFWTQLSLSDTELFTLIHTVIEILDDGQVTNRDLTALMALGWTPPDVDDDWPMATGVAIAGVSDGPEGPILLDKNHNESEHEWGDERITRLANWLVSHADPPSPETVTHVLDGLVQRYRNIVLDEVKSQDSQALCETETAARTVVRCEALVHQTVAKYRRRLRNGQGDRSWTQVTSILESIATQSPGRREHANARAIDILEANDIWGRRIPYVITMGLVDGLWPQRPDSMLPADVQHAILSGAGSAPSLVPRTRWVGGRDADQFSEALTAAERGVVITRHKQTHEGREVNRSPLLDGISTERLEKHGRRRLLAYEAPLPETITKTLPIPRGEVQ